MAGIAIRRLKFEDFDGIQVARRIDVMKDGQLAMEIRVIEVTPAGTVSPEIFKLRRRLSVSYRSHHDWKGTITTDDKSAYHSLSPAG